MPPVHPIHRRYLAEELVRLRRSDDERRYVASQRTGRIDPNPHQIDAVIFALGRVREGGCILADEVGLGKTIEAGLVIAQLRAEGAKRILLVTPKPLLGQWRQELFTLFGIETREASAAPGALDGPGVFLIGRELAGSEKGEQALRSAARFDLCVIDEAHEIFAGIYRRFARRSDARGDAPQARMAGRFRAALEGSLTPVLLLTATPIQNSLAELWGLVQYVDPTGTLLGDLPTFRAMFCDGDDRLLAAGQEHELRRRIATICRRTLRRQAQEFMKRPFVDRKAQLFEYAMSPVEKALYDDITDYLLEPAIAAFRGSQRRLLLIGFHRRMASSVRALTQSLEKVAERLRRMLGGVDLALLDEAAAFTADLEDDELAGEENAESNDDGTGDGDAAPDRESATAELARVERFIARAKALPSDSKALALLRAVGVVLERGKSGAGSGKLVIFTESLTTQDYLRDLLLESGLVGDDEVTLFRGNNDSARAAAALRRWQEEVGNALARHHQPSRDVAVRLALVHEFQTRSRVFISTEAGAKGLNLQFCETLVNYDLPWNPQRIEQRIGRCHRYGQKRGVTVINFLARDNEAQRLTFEILSQKLELFGTVLDASDVVLHEAGATSETLAGALGADFETQLRRIYERARTIDEIECHLRELRESMDSRRREYEDTHRRTSGIIESRFDAAVRLAFRRIQEELPAGLAELDRDLDRVLTAYLDARGIAYERIAAPGHTRFVIAASPELPADFREGAVVATGDVQSMDGADPLSLIHPLVLAAVADARLASSRRFQVRFESARDDLRGRRGRLVLLRICYQGFEPVERILPVVVLEGERAPLAPEEAEALLLSPVSDAPSLDAPSLAPPLALSDADLDDAIEELRFADEAEASGAEHEHFERALEQIERFVEDRTIVLRRQRDEVARRLADAETKRDAALGASARTAAEQTLAALTAEIEELDARIAKLEARDDEAYTKWRAQAHQRRYAKASAERLLEADFVIA